MSHKPEVATNRGGETVAGALKGYWNQLIAERHEPPALAIATAYVNPGGLQLLAEPLERAGHVRLLLGAEPDVPESLARRRHLDPETLPEDDPQVRVERAIEQHDRDLAEDRDLAPFTDEHDRRMRRLIEWLRSGRVEVRRLTTRFLHGKAFIVETGNEGVLAGSSNLTHAGLARNLELNLGQYQPSVVGNVMAWYEELWAEAEPFDLAAVYEQRYEAHAPYLIYLRMLWERYAAELAAEDTTPPGLPLTEFQRAGLYRARDYLEHMNGVLIADGVGLGKTFLAGELIREIFFELRQRVLLIAPAALRDGPWKRFRQEYDLMGVQCISFHELAEDYRLGKGDRAVLWHDPNDYAMVVIDEAHGFRNPETGRSATLRQLLSGSPPKKVVLLTATPVNNQLMDLYHLISYFVQNDAAFLDAGIPSLREHFREVQRTHPDELSPDRLFDVLDAVAVRRTRRFVKKHFSHDTVEYGGHRVQIAFPDSEVHRVDYAFDQALPGFFERFAHALGVDPTDDNNSLPDPSGFTYGDQLTLARYAPSAYLIDEDPEQYELQAAGLLRSGLLKRFESSPHAFARTCRTMAASHQRFLDAMESGWVLTGQALANWAHTAADAFDPDAEVHGTVARTGLYDIDRLHEAVAADRDMLEAFASEAESLGSADDPKTNALADELAAIAADARAEAASEREERDKRKVIVFTQFKDTVDWIHDGLQTAIDNDPRLAAYRGRMETIAGGDDESGEKLFNFAPSSTEAPDDWEDTVDILITTDVLAEGVNLQQCRHIVNYDLPWNPMRIVQRHGRVDRIGSPHRRVFLRCFFPAASLDQLLGLESALQRKIAQAAASIGVEGEIVPGSASSEHVFAHTREQIESLRREESDLLENTEEAGALSGEEFRWELAEALRQDSWRRAIESLPWASGSGVAIRGAREPGFVFCARVGDHPRPLYRWVPLTAPATDVDRERIERDTLKCLAEIPCRRDTPRHLSEPMQQLVYSAWEAARDDIHEAWLPYADPASFKPAVPKAMRDARAHLDRYPPPELEQHQLVRVRDSIEVPYTNRILARVREILRRDEDSFAISRALVELVDELGLQPPVDIEPLPEIDVSDVHLVCWMAVVAE
ncbi:MAG: helicase-related protein [Halofilum sp. (in: g-proteobacteria)]|nr:helicase-related protein [Halofilum sp. (in: g-proteobacteria)]